MSKQKKAKSKKLEVNDVEQTTSFTEDDMDELALLLKNKNSSDDGNESESESENTAQETVQTEIINTQEPTMNKTIIIDDENNEHVVDLDSPDTQVNVSEMGLDNLPKQDIHVFKGINQITLTFVIPPEDMPDDKDAFIDVDGTLIYTNNPFTFFRNSKENPVSIPATGNSVITPEKVPGYFMKFYSNFMNILNAANEDVRDYRKLNNADSVPDEFKKYSEVLANVFITNLPTNPNILRTRVDSVSIKQNYINACMLNLSIIYKANIDVIDSVMKHAASIKEFSKDIAVRVSFVADLNRAFVKQETQISSLAQWADAYGHSHDNNLAKEFISDKKTVRREVLGGQTKDEIEPHVILVKTL